MTLLTIVQEACARIGITQPTTVVSNQDAQISQIYNLAQQVGKDLSRTWDWQILTKEATFTTVATEEQATLTTLAPDYDRISSQTIWNRTQGRRVVGPLNAQEWQKKKGSFAQAGIRDYFRIRGGKILFNPVPPAGDSVYFEYISKNWCESSGGTDQAAWAADSDVGILDEELMKLGIIVAFKRAKGLDYGEERNDYMMRLNMLTGNDGGNPNLDMSPTEYILGVNLPDSNWNI
jgi:hypothetical protein